MNDVVFVTTNSKLSKRKKTNTLNLMKNGLWTMKKTDTFYIEIGDELTLKSIID